MVKLLILHPHASLVAFSVRSLTVLMCPFVALDIKCINSYDPLLHHVNHLFCKFRFVHLLHVVFPNHLVIDTHYLLFSRLDDTSP